MLILRRPALLSSLFLSMLVLSCSLLAQDAPPTPQQGGATQPPPTATIRTNARIVLVDVVVHDKSNNPVRGLTASDFTVTEAGKPQKIRSFEEHSTESTATLPPAPPMPPGDFTNYTTTAPGATLNVVLLDSLNTPFADQIFVRQALSEFVKKAAPGTQIAVFGLTTRLLYLQGFTSDPQLLRAIVDKKLRPHDSPLLNTPGGGADSGLSISATPTPDEQTPAFSQSVGIQAAVAGEFERYNASVQTQLRVRYTLDAMNTLGKYLSTFPGRKNLIWFSGSFPLNILPEVDTARDSSPFAGTMDMQEEFRETTDLMSRAQVAVYPVDARGLVGDSTGALFSPKGQRQFSENMADTIGTMRQMAEQTGGKAYFNTNGLSDAMADAIHDGSVYYTLAYTPSENKQDGSYRAIHVTLDRPGVTLEYRRGYFTDDASHPRPADLRTVAASSDPALRAAMQHGGPGLSELTFRIAAAPVSTPVHDGNKLDNVTGALTRGPFTTYSIRYAIDAANVGFVRTEDKRFRSDMRFLVFVYDRDGRLLEGVTRSPQSTLDAAGIHNILQRGLQFPLEIDVPSKGDYFLRVAVEDRIRHRFGSLELPLESIRKLPPVAPLPAPALNQRDTPETIPETIPTPDSPASTTAPSPGRPK